MIRALPIAANMPKEQESAALVRHRRDVGATNFTCRLIRATNCNMMVRCRRDVGATNRERRILVDSDALPAQNGCRRDIGATNCERRGLKSKTAGSLLHKIEACQHNQHGARNAQPEASDENLPNNERLSGGQADDDSQPVDDVKDDRTNREE